jgi:hypothetical protein
MDEAALRGIAARGLGAGRVRLRYLDRNVYLPSESVLNIRRVALADGWQLADFVRILIVLGLSFRLMRVTSDEMLSHAKLMWAFGEFGGVFTGGSRRRYSPRTGGGMWLPLHIPEGLLRAVTMQAELSSRSRNDILATALKEGLLIYLLAHHKLLQTILRLRKEKSKLSAARGNRRNEKTA